MKTFENIDEILDFAMEAEQRAIDFYKKLAANATNEEMKNIFKDFAAEEMKHKSRLLDLKKTKLFEQNSVEVTDLRISDFVAKQKPYDNMNYEEALVVAMHQEKAAFRLYTEMAKRTQNTELKNVFLELAQEEAKHKLRFEIEYDEFVLREN